MDIIPQISPAMKTMKLDWGVITLFDEFLGLLGNLEFESFAPILLRFMRALASERGEKRSVRR